MTAPTLRHPFIAIEGCDGVGKSTIRDALRDGLVESGMTVMMVGQHSWLNPRYGRLILNVREQRQKHAPEEIAEAYFVDKRLHAFRTVVPALEDAAVIADRFIISDAVYQEVLYGIDATETLKRHHQAGTPFPTLTLLIELDADEAYKRVLGRSKHTRHYERPAEMRSIMEVYDRVLVREPLPFLPPLVRFENDRINWRERVKNELLPSVLRHCEPRSSR